MSRTAMPDLPHAAPAAAGSSMVSRYAELPGLRTLRSGGFRTTLAFALLVIGTLLVATLLVRQASSDVGQYAIDFGAYHLAAERMVSGESPYSPEMLVGPVSAQGVDRYLYPPLFAQLLTPFTALTLDQAALLWLVLQAIAMFAAVWIGSGIGGATVSLERALWCGVAVVFFLPVFDTLWKGNVSGILALTSVAVAAGGAAAGVGAATGALLKAVPGTLVPAALVMDRRSRLAVIISLALGFGISFILAPAVWLDYLTVLRNMLAGSVDYANNLAPAAVAQRFGVGETGATVVRELSLAAAAICLGASVIMARTTSGRPAAALLGAIALLLIPGSLWYHYLAVLLPFAALAWPRADGVQRGLIFLGAAMVTIGLAWLPLALIGAIILATAALVVVWPTASRAGRVAHG